MPVSLLSEAKNRTILSLAVLLKSKALLKTHSLLSLKQFRKSQKLK